MEKSVRSFVRSLARCGVRVAALRRRGNLERWPTERRPRPHVRHTQHAEPRRDIIKRNVRRFSPPSRPSFRSASSSRLAPAVGLAATIQRQQIVRGSDTTENAEKINLLRLKYKMSSLDDHLVRLGGEHRASLSVGQVFHVYSTVLGYAQSVQP